MSIFREKTISKMKSLRTKLWVWNIEGKTIEYIVKLWKKKTTLAPLCNLVIRTSRGLIPSQGAVALRKQFTSTFFSPPICKIGSWKIVSECYSKALLLWDICKVLWAVSGKLLHKNDLLFYFIWISAVRLRRSVDLKIKNYATFHANVSLGLSYNFIKGIFCYSTIMN